VRLWMVLELHRVVRLSTTAGFTSELRACYREAGLHTRGALGSRAPEWLLDATDLLPLDIKSFDPASTGG
jgi:hypothetical protein